MDIAQGQYLPCDLYDFSSLSPCQNKPLHLSAKDLNHLSTGASSCYLDNCQQEHAVAPSCSLLTILHTWLWREGVRMPIIFTVCCAGYSGEAECCWLPDRSWQHPEPEIPANRLSSVFFLRQQGVPCGHEPGDGAQRCLSHKPQCKVIFLFIFKHALATEDQNSYKKKIHVT